MKTQSSTGWAHIETPGRTRARCAKRRRAKSLVRLQLTPLITLEQHDRYDEGQENENGYRAGDRPIAILEKLIRQYSSDHELVGTSKERGNNVFAHGGNKHQERSGDDSRHRLRQCDPQECCDGIRAEIGCRLEQGVVMFLEIRV